MKQATSEADAVASLAALHAEQINEAAEQLLVAASAAPSVQSLDKPVCDRFFAVLLERFPAYGNLGAADARGQLVCSAVPDPAGRLYIGDRSYFRRATATRQLSLEYVRGRVTGRPSLTYALPVLDSQDRLQGAVFAALSLAELGSRLRSLSLPEHLQAFLLTDDGTVLAAAPVGAAAVGTKLPLPSLAAGPGGADGRHGAGRTPSKVDRVIGLRGSSANGLKVAVRADVDQMLAPGTSRLRWQLAALGLLVALSAAAAIVIGNRRLIRPASGLLARIRAFERGERPPPPRHEGSDEIDQLSLAFEAMSDQLTARGQERERLLADIQVAQERLLTAQRLSRTAYWEWDLFADRVWISQDLDLATGAPLRDVTAMADYLHRIPEPERATVEASIREAAEGRGTVEAEHRAVAADGRTVWLRTVGELELDTAGRPARLRGSMQDITRRKEAEASAEDLARRLTATLETMADGFFTLDRHWHFTYVNRRAEALMRRSRSALLGQCIWTVFPDEGNHPFRQAYERALAQGVASEVEAHYAPLDLWVHCVAYPTDEGIAVYVRDVTERRRAEEEREALLQRERRARRDAEAAKLHFRALFEAAPGLYLVLTAEEDARIVAASHAYLQATYTRREDIVGKRMFDVFPDDPADRQASGVHNLRRSIERVRRTGRADVMAVQRYPIRRPAERGGGFEERYWSPVNSPVFGPEGELAYVIHRVEDVTAFVREHQRQGGEQAALHALATRAEQMEADVVLRSQELQRLNERLRSAQRVAQLGNWELHLSDHTLVWSEQTYHIFGLQPSEEELTLSRVLESIEPADRERVREAHLQDHQHGTGLDLEWGIRRPDGERRTLHCLAEVLVNEQGAPVVISGTVQDVSERRRTDARLRAQLGQLGLLHRITRAIGERVDVQGILRVVVDQLEANMPADASLVLSYDAARDQLTVSELGSRSAPALEAATLGTGTQIPAGEDGLAGAIEGKLIYEPSIAELDYRFTRQLRQAEVGSMVIAPIRFERVTFGVLLVGRRVAQSFSSTDCEFLAQLGDHVALAMRQAHLHASLQEAFDELRRTQQAVLQHERLRALGEMASGIAHDINNAISPVMLFVESLLKREAGLSPTGRTKLETIRLAIDDVARTVERMGEFYRRDEVPGRRRLVSINQIVRQVLALTQARWRDMAQQAGVVIEVQTELDDQLPDMWLNESEMREALTNLVLNAADAMPDGGTLRLRTSGGREGHGSGVTVCVADTGIGMDEDTRRRSVEPFFTTKGERGTGLGLAIVYGIVQRHGGQMEIRSAPGKGTTVRIELPAGLPRAEPPTEPAIPAEFRRLKLLLVDDDPLVLGPLAEALSEVGHEVQQCSDGRQALSAVRRALLARQPYDAVVTDLGMPGLDGSVVAREVKSLSPGTRVVMLTGWGRRMSDTGAPPAGVDVLLGKPPRLEEVLAALAAA